jgi:hypothetical protein
MRGEGDAEIAARGGTTMSNDTMQIQGNQTIAEIERELRLLCEKCPQYLQLPVTPRKWWFGGEASLVQLIITWGVRTPNATVATHIGEEEEPEVQLKRLAARPFGFVATWMAQEVVDRAKKRALKLVANRFANDQIIRMFRGNQWRSSEQQGTLWGGGEEGHGWETPSLAEVGRRLFFACVDHHPKWRIPQFYFPSGELRYRDDFVGFAKGLIGWAERAVGTITKTPKMIQQIGAFLHELMKNTHLWARTDEDEVPRRRSVRGMMVDAHTWDQEQTSLVYEGSEALRRYILGSGRPTRARHRYLEISIFDSGVGLARHWLSRKRGKPIDLKALSPQDEYQACWECFQRWQTSSTLTHKGLGLHEVMTTLSQLRGFLRVRTGRLSFFRDFVTYPYGDNEKPSAEDFFDWTTNSPSLAGLSAVEGVLYTILIPIGA